MQSEQLVEEVKGNRVIRRWQQQGANHFLDLAVYGLAGLYLLGLKTVSEGLGPMADALSAPYDPDEVVPTVRRSRGRRMLRSGDSLL